MIKVKLKELKPNPFRDFGDCPIIGWKVDALVTSIQKTDFWDNILVRQNKTKLNPDGEFQIAYGHHRLEAVKRLYGDDFELELPSKDIDDDNMLRIVLEENSDIYFKDGKTDITALDSGVKQVWERLLAISTLKLVWTPFENGGGIYKLAFTDLPIPKDFKFSCIAKQIQVWLDTNWSEKIISISLLNLRAKGKIQFPEAKKGEDGQSVTAEVTIKTEDEEGNVEEITEEVVDTVLVDQEEIVDEEAMGTITTHEYAVKFRQMITKIHNGDHELILAENQGKVEPKKQRQIVNNIISKEDIMPREDAYNRHSMDLEAVRVIDGKKRAEEIEFKTFRKEMTELVKLTSKLSGKYKTMNRNIQGNGEISGFSSLFQKSFGEFKFELAIVKLCNEVGKLVGRVPESKNINMVEGVVIDVKALPAKGEK